MNDRIILREQLYGIHSHVHILHGLEGLDPELVGRAIVGSPHTVFQVLRHMIYWQDISLARMNEDSPAEPQTAAEGWSFPMAPEDDSDWEATVASFAEGLRTIEERIANPDIDLDRVVDARHKRTTREQILMVSSHNSYHLGQLVQLRLQLGSWPPPRGGQTW